jgi:hypothetical protein
MAIDFIPGRDLSRQFYRELVRPRLDTHFPNIPHSAALIGYGSEVLGFDTVRSTDHDWGPRVMLFVTETDYPVHGQAIREALLDGLPELFRNYRLEPQNNTKDSRCIQIHSLREFLLGYLGFDILEALQPADWLTFPSQKLRGFTQGAVFWDGVGLEQARQRFAYYPHDVWLYLLASGWSRIGEEEHLMGRAGEAGDEIGSALIAAQLVRDLMRLCFLIEKQYAPYPKWFGTAFTQLEIASELAPLFRAVLTSATWQERQVPLARAYEVVAARHNRMGLTEPLQEKASYFFERPFLVINGENFANVLRAKISDPAVKTLSGRRLIGSIDQFSDSTDMLEDTGWRKVLRQLYE